MVEMEEGAATYAADLLAEYTKEIDGVVESVSFERDEWVVAESNPDESVMGTESIPFPAHNLKIFSADTLAELEEDMREVALQAVAAVLPDQHVDCVITMHQGEPQSTPPIPPSASTRFTIASLSAQAAAAEAA